MGHAAVRSGLRGLHDAGSSSFRCLSEATCHSGAALGWTAPGSLRGCSWTAAAAVGPAWCRSTGRGAGGNMWPQVLIGARCLPGDAPKVLKAGKRRSWLQQPLPSSAAQDSARAEPDDCSGFVFSKFAPNSRGSQRQLGAARYPRTFQCLAFGHLFRFSLIRRRRAVTHQLATCRTVRRLHCIGGHAASCSVFRRPAARTI